MTRLKIFPNLQKVFIMKNLLLLCFVLLVGSCTRIGDQVEIDIVEAEYDGHSYLVFSGHGVIHNPNCNCK